MVNYNFVYKDVEGASTRWIDIQRKFGNLPAKPPAFKPPPFEPAPDSESASKDKPWIDQKIEEELECCFDRKKRLAEMREAAKVLKYGSVIQISGSDFVREVSQAPQDVWVVVLLYKEGFPEFGLLLRCLKELAVKYPATKFVEIISTDCIPNYPDRNLPTLGVALVLCQSDPVLNDGQSEGDQPQKAVLEGVRRRFIEKVVTEHEDQDDGGSSSV
ncbi:SYP121 protein [Hibiscus syriacus]|uniref:SYP121 protein n=1 Tax=Hibiscus syriacus TaxID=106335 RepID=A0A6A3BPR6_HIBSY|nr:SYP121 protein [Hibiscus syriacus]